MNEKNVEKIFVVIVLVFIIKGQVNLITAIPQIIEMQKGLAISAQKKEEKESLADKVLDFYGNYKVGFSGSTASVLGMIELPTTTTL